MALAYALRQIEANRRSASDELRRVPGEASRPPTKCEIIENTSWSCAHGIERWRSDCGCNSGGHPGWNQAGGGRCGRRSTGSGTQLAALFEDEGPQAPQGPVGGARRLHRRDPRPVRTPPSTHFSAGTPPRPLTPSRRSAALKLLEMQRHAMLMYTSCGWFFDELSGIETVQVIQYAGRVVQLSARALRRLRRNRVPGAARAGKSNVPEHEDGRTIYDKFVKPAMVDLHKVGAHYAVSALFENFGERSRIFCYDVEREDFRVQTAGRTKLILGRRGSPRRSRGNRRSCRSASCTWGITTSAEGSATSGDEEAYETLTREIGDVFKSADLPEVIRTVDKHFGLETYSLKLLFRDELRKILHMILDQTLSETEGSHLQIYQQNATMMRFLSGMGIPLPDPLYASARVALTRSCAVPYRERASTRPSSTGSWKRAAASASRSIR